MLYMKNLEQHTTPDSNISELEIWHTEPANLELSNLELSNLEHMKNNHQPSTINYQPSPPRLESKEA